MALTNVQARSFQLTFLHGSSSLFPSTLKKGREKINRTRNSAETTGKISRACNFSVLFIEIAKKTSNNIEYL